LGRALFAGFTAAALKVEQAEDDGNHRGSPQEGTEELVPVEG